MSKYVISIDIGTTGTRAIAFSKDLKIIAKSYYELNQFYPKPSWVEQNPKQIWELTFKALSDVINTIGIDKVECIGITNQRETKILWDKKTSEPVYNAITWQCRRTEEICKELKKYKNLIKQKTGLNLDPYFSATKIKWILDNIELAKTKYDKNELIFGTVDTWILYNLTKGKSHYTEPTIASRTLLFNIHTLQYDQELLNIFNIKENILPLIKQTSDFFGYLDKSYLWKRNSNNRNNRRSTSFTIS
ncbi:MAG: FGGY family carbohydrate kinase [bacterium]